LRLKNEDIFKAVLSLNDSVLTQEQIKSLKDIAPTADELGQVVDYETSKQDIELLGTCERFYLTISKIPRYEQRLSSWVFKNNFPSIISSIQPDVETLSLAIKQLLESQKFLKLLQIILSLGNFLNSGKKGVHGFTISSLVRLKELKATGAKTNLLAYIISFCLQKYPEILEFKKELSQVLAASRVNLGQSKIDLQEIKKGINQVGNEIDQSTVVSKLDNFRAVMGEFIFLSK